MTKGGLQPGQALVLTKPLGTGTLMAAAMRGAAKGRWLAGALSSMQASNEAAARVLQDHGATGCTDVTGASRCYPGYCTSICYNAYCFAQHTILLFNESPDSALCNVSLAVTRLAGAQLCILVNRYFIF